MAQYLINVLDDRTGSATDGEMAAIHEFNAKMQAGGNWVFAAGLAEPGASTVIDARAGEPMLTDGPYLESKEYIAGVWIIEAADYDVALKLATEGSKSCHRRVELRPLLAE